MKSITYCFMVLVVGLQGCASLMVQQEPVKVIQPTVVQNFEFGTTGSESVMPYQVFHDSKNTYLDEYVMTKYANSLFKKGLSELARQNIQYFKNKYRRER